MPRKLGIKEAKQRAGRFCAFQERSSQEIHEKLTSWGLQPEEAEKVVAELIQEGFVNDQRFADAYCHDKFQFNGWGKLKIKAHIYSHGISEDVLVKALDRIDPKAYESKLMELGKTKWQKSKDDDLAKRKQKTAAFLQQRGFETDLIWEAINKLERQ